MENKPTPSEQEIEKKLEELQETAVTPVSIESCVKPWDREIPRRVNRYNYQDSYDDGYDDRRE
jgi:hypothetical protein